MGQVVVASGFHGAFSGRSLFFVNWPLSEGQMTSCSLFNSAAAFQHEKEPSELNVSLDDLQSKRHSPH